MNELKKRVQYSRAIEAGLWGMPLVNFAAMRRAYFRDAGAEYNDVLYFSKVANWKFQTTTANNANYYGFFFYNLKEAGPMVLEIPPSGDVEVFGTVTNAWNAPLVDLGIRGDDEGAGGKYLILPHDYAGDVPHEYFSATSQTNGIYALLRYTATAGTEQANKDAVAMLQNLKVYPLNNPNKKIKYIDVYDKTFDGVPPLNIDFYKMLSDLVREEPVLKRDLSMLGQLYSLGIGKNLEFNPSSEEVAMFEKAVKEVFQYSSEIFMQLGEHWWPNRKWIKLGNDEIRATKAQMVLKDRVIYDNRAAVFYGLYAVPVLPAPNQYAKTYYDVDGEMLDGSYTYKVHVPAHVPTKQFWSFNVYDNETAAFARGESRNGFVVGLDSLNNKMQENADGSHDIYFGPKAPAGCEANWISTIEGRNFFVLWRNYLPPREVLMGTHPWTLGDIEKVKN